MDTDISIQGYREIISENPYKEMWNQLYYFTDVDRINRDIRKKFNLETGEHEDNTEKQARQIAYSIMQADNYFRAAQEVDVSVKPNLIYYGIVALSNTVVLYNNDGKFSLDYLRDQKREKHHGLEDKFSLKKDGSTEEILEGISCEIYRKPSEPNKGEPYGHFKNFYNSVVPEFVFFDQRIFFQSQASHSLENKLTIQNINKGKIKTLSVVDLDFLIMLKFLPDMIGQLSDNGIKSNLYPGNIIESLYKTKYDKDGKMDPQIRQWDKLLIDIHIDEVSAEAKEYFKNLCSQDNSIIPRNEYVHNLHFSIDIKSDSGEGYMPGTVQDLSGKIYFIYEEEKYIQELAIFYICFFCTGMLCRYYPDYWMRWLEKNVGFRHLMDRLCSVAIRKFPNLILNQLTRQINHFHL